jgi:hypothetical protein
MRHEHASTIDKRLQKPEIFLDCLLILNERLSYEWRRELIADKVEVPKIDPASVNRRYFIVVLSE